MTVNEIIKALECHADERSSCDECPYRTLGCSLQLAIDIIGFINRQQAEIERLQKENNQLADIGKMYSEIKAEAIKEFAERIKENTFTYSGEICTYDAVMVKWIDKCVKEMTGGKT